MELCTCKFLKELEGKGTPECGVMCAYPDRCDYCGFNPEVAHRRTVAMVGEKEAERLRERSWERSAYNKNSRCYGENYE